MKIRIGVLHSSRELEIDVDLSRDELAAKVADASSNGTLLQLTDDKGRTLMVPGQNIAFVQHSDEEPRRVGFLG